MPNLKENTSVDKINKEGNMAKNEDKKNKKNDPSLPGHGGGKGDAPQPKGVKPGKFKDIPGNQS
jgi:hypothetical protein